MLDHIWSNCLVRLSIISIQSINWTCKLILPVQCSSASGCSGASGGVVSVTGPADVRSLECPQLWFCLEAKLIRSRLILVLSKT